MKGLAILIGILCTLPGFAYVSESGKSHGKVSLRCDEGIIEEPFLVLFSHGTEITTFKDDYSWVSYDSHKNTVTVAKDCELTLVNGTEEGLALNPQHIYTKREAGRLVCGSDVNIAFQVIVHQGLAGLPFQPIPNAKTLVFTGKSFDRNFQLSDWFSEDKSHQIKLRCNTSHLKFSGF